MSNIRTGYRGALCIQDLIQDCPEFENRFWSKVDKSDDCWFWTGAKTDGYGSIFVNGKTLRAHRVAKALDEDDAIHTHQVNHDCPNEDERSCVNPEHLYLGDSSDNQKDRRGNRLDYAEIRNRYKTEDVSMRDLADEYDCHQSTISRIINEKFLGQGAGSP